MAAKLVLYGRALGLSHGESEDLVQDLFVRLLQREEDPDEPIRYCLRAFRNRAFNYRKSLWRRLTREWEAQAWFEVRADELDPRETAAMRCLATLPPEQREVVVLKIWHGLTFATIAEMVQLSPNTVAGRYRYGLRRLRRALEKLTEDEIEIDREAYAVLDRAAGLTGAE